MTTKRTISVGTMSVIPAGTVVTMEHAMAALNPLGVPKINTGGTADGKMLAFQQVNNSRKMHEVDGVLIDRATAGVICQLLDLISREKTIELLSQSVGTIAAIAYSLLTKG